MRSSKERSMAVPIGQSSNILRRKSSRLGYPQPYPRTGMARVSEIALTHNAFERLRRIDRIPDFGRFSVARRETTRSLKPPSISGAHAPVTGLRVHTRTGWNGIKDRHVL